MSSISKKVKRLFYKEKPLVKVYSHPRSGTHFLEAFLAKNFYKTKDLSIDKVTWGHWSDRRIKADGNPYGKLFGNHYFGFENQNSTPKIYIYRDGRAVAYSIWKTPNFISKEEAGITFNDFLNKKIDWSGTPARKAEPECTIFQHWAKHVSSWKKLAKSDENLLMIRYEDLVDDPYSIYQKIHNKFFIEQLILKTNQIDVIKKPLGLLPNKGVKNEWTKHINDQNSRAYEGIENITV
jgi:hypothetical protein